MSLFYNLLQEQINLLKEKGYDEKVINSPNKEGWLFTQLRQSFSDALHYSLHEDEPETFQIATTCFFNNNKDIIHFTFNYKFTPEHDTLSLIEIEFVHDNNRKTISIQSSRDIPHSSEVLMLIKGNTHLQRNRIVRQIPERFKEQQNKIR